jgi:hypothetical protein
MSTDSGEAERDGVAYRQMLSNDNFELKREGEVRSRYRLIYLQIIAKALKNQRFRYNMRRTSLRGSLPRTHT